MALEMARRGLVGATVALAPGGFWNEKERRYVRRPSWPVAGSPA